MPNILNKKGFIDRLSSFLGKNYVSEVNSSIIKIEETEKSGKGEIFLDFSDKIIDKEHFLLKIKHDNTHKIGKDKLSIKISDGIILYVNLKIFIVEIFLCELKTSATTQNIEKAQLQLSSANRLIDTLNLDCKFKVNRNIIIGFKNNRYNSLELRNLNINNIELRKLHEVWKDNKNKFPIINLFCKDSYYNFYKIEFDNTQKIN